MGEVVAVASDEPDASIIAPRHDAEAIVQPRVNFKRASGQKVSASFRKGQLRRI
jgi:hypothetical protein